MDKQPKHETAPNDQEDRASTTTRKPYHRPSLRHFGDVRALTRSLVASANGDAGAAMMTASDRRLKQNIVRIGEHPLGFGLYLFDYGVESKGEVRVGRRFGVMADEVRDIVPDAVQTSEDGFLSVDYSRLGIRLAH